MSDTTAEAGPVPGRPSVDTAVVHGRPSIDPVYEFNAPQFHDFTNARDDPVAAESYFENGRRVTISKVRIVPVLGEPFVPEPSTIVEEERPEQVDDGPKQVDGIHYVRI